LKAKGHVDSSEGAWEQARQVIPGGVSRDQLFIDPPFFASRGEGPYLFDPAGVRHLDFVNNYTSLIHGHAHAGTVAAIVEQAKRGTAYGAPSELEAVLAREIVERLEAADMVRFTNSGTEATMLALQLARHLTGRTRIAKFEGGYHGSHELVRVSIKPEAGGPRDRPEAVAEEGAEGFNLTDVVPFDDLDAFEQIAADRGDRWAALIVEPMQGSAGMLPAPPGLLQKCRELADRYGFLLVFDEVMTFRHGGHGLQAEWQVRPDLTTLGKIIGGGLAVGAVAGAASAMRALAPPAPNRIHHSGTFNGNPLTMAAGIATLNAYDEAAAKELDSRGDRLRSRLQESLAGTGLSVTGWGSMMNVHATPQAPKSWRDVRESDRARMAEIQRGLLKRGVFIAPRGMMCLSTAHREEHFDELEEALLALAAATSDRAAPGRA
jgi:glutamate-1-semialdehyde 2,1-aminomutase